MDRRKFLATTVITTGALAGCLGDDNADELQDRLDVKNETIAELEEDLDDANTEVVTKADRIEALEDDLDSKQAKLQGLETDNDELEREIEAIESELDRLKPERTFTDDELETAKEVGLEARTAVSTIYTEASIGTAFHIGDGEHLTNEHIIAGTERSRFDSLETFDEQTIDWDVGEMDRDEDIAVIESRRSIDSSLTDFGSVSEGDVVVAVGHPENVGYWVLSVGRVIDTSRFGGVDSLTIDAPSHPGTSGSPVLNMDGEVVGMIRVAYEPNEELLDRPDELTLDYVGLSPGAEAVGAAEIEQKLSRWGYR